MIDPYTIGRESCEISLNQVLNEFNDDKITNTVLKKINKLKNGLKQLSFIPNQEFRTNIISTYFKTFKDNIPKNLPTIVYTLTLCCCTVYYRQYLKGKKN